MTNSATSSAISNDENSSTLKRTPLYDLHKRDGARFVGFGGWDMPVRYSSIAEEHKCVREAVGLFDVSHMGEIVISGPSAFESLNYLSSNDLSKLSDGQAQYSLLLNDEGGVVDDIIIYRLSGDEFLLCVNAANTEKDFKWLKSREKFGADIKNVSSDYAQIAVQGPKARVLFSRLLGMDEESIADANFPSFTFKEFETALPSGKNAKLLVATTGYTGEDGVEIFCSPDSAGDVWDSLLKLGGDLGVKAIGLGARDTLRLEVCYPLHGHELRDDVSALSSKLAWVIALGKGDFIGRDALLKQKQDGVEPQLVGFEVLGKGIIREESKILSTDGEVIGWVASGTKPPTVDKAVGMAFVPKSFSKLGEELLADNRGRQVPIRVVKRPFYKRSS
ncbi:glycine cleavage system protein T [bacterium J17]|nr:glycine cleavage system protein T [bacterium J17]